MDPTRTQLPTLALPALKVEGAFLRKSASAVEVARTEVDKISFKQLSGAHSAPAAGVTGSALRKAPTRAGQVRELGFLATTLNGLTGEQAIRILRATTLILPKVPVALVETDLDGE